ncbi:MAG: M28 family peptidase [Asgard group archaeon]|nr:M28 family peptidase [Asgard group archaeon]
MEEIIDNVDIENLYQHVLNVEGIKNPINSQDRLNEVADYIVLKFKEYGLEVSEQHFKIEGFDYTFRNIEGYFGDGKGPEVLVTCHYDTVYNSPGANDNGSGIAGMLEAARVIAKINPVLNIRFVAFTLEEFNPNRLKKSFDFARELGLVDTNNKYLTYNAVRLLKEFNQLRYKLLRKGKSIANTFNLALEKMKDKLTSKELQFLEFLKELYSKETKLTWVGKAGLIGSCKWVEKALDENREIVGVVNLETVGYTSNRKHSQQMPSILLPLLFPKFKVRPLQMKGNFILITADKNSRKLAKVFSKQCKNKLIKLPFIRLGLPLKYEAIAKRLGDALRSDHAPFWRENIPALMITDTANFRYPFYHTEADTIDKLNFDFIKKVTQVTIATAIGMLKKK